MDMMGMPLWAWIVFYILVFLMLIADLKMFGRKGQHEVGIGEALKMTAVWRLRSSLRDRLRTMA